jgi:DNA-binding MarR family transcriptional regulator
MRIPLKNEEVWLTEEQQVIWRSLLLAMDQIDTYLNDDLAPYDLSMSEYRVLVILSEAEDQRVRMSTLSNSTNHSPSRLSHMISRMETRGLVERSLCMDDRRGTWVALTSVGLRLLKESAPEHVASVRRIVFDVADPKDLEAVGRVAQAALNRLSEITNRRPIDIKVNSDIWESAELEAAS